MPDRIIHEEWQQQWGHEYDPKWKQGDLVPVLESLVVEGKLGTVVVDVGSGAFPISKMIDGKLRKGLKIIELDIAAPAYETEDSIRAKIDVENLAKKDFESRRVLVALRQWLKNKGFTTEEAVVDSAIFSDVLNYINYENVLPELLPLLKEGGRVIIFNAPRRGYKSLFRVEPKGNIDIFLLLRKLGIRLEILKFNNTDFNTTDFPSIQSLDGQMMLYVGVKGSINSSKSGIEAGIQ